MRGLKGRYEPRQMSEARSDRLYCGLSSQSQEDLMYCILIMALGSVFLLNFFKIKYTCTHYSLESGS